MKKLKWGFAIIIVLTLFAGLFYQNMSKNNGFERTEFMFDTQCTVAAYGKDAKAAVGVVFDRLAEIHNVTNFFSEDSEGAMINNAAAGEEVNVCEDMKRILSAALEIGVASDGAFDVGIAPVTGLWDFAGAGRVPEDAEIRQALENVNEGNILLDRGRKIVTKKVGSAKIDLGGAAKGYAGDVAIEVLEKFQVDGAVVDLGGNITVMGNNPNTKDGRWRIGMQKPYSPTGEVDEVLEIAIGAVVTSGTYQRYFERDGTRYHHIIDPHTGYPADRDYSSVTVVAESGLYADCLATACFVLGRDAGQTLAEEFGAEVYFR